MSWIAPRIEALQPPWAPCATAWSLSHSENVFPGGQREAPVFQFTPTPAGPVTGYHWAKPGSIFFTPSFQILYTYIYICRWVFFPSPFSLPFFIKKVFQSLNYFHGSLLSSFLFVHVSHAEPSTGPSIPKCRIEGKDHLPKPGNTPNAAPVTH